jgi:hypothetical protein
MNKALDMKKLPLSLLLLLLSISTASAQCTRQAPALEVVPERHIGSSAPVTYKIWVENKDSVDCFFTNFTISFPAGPWTFSGAPDVLYVLSGNKGAFTVTFDMTDGASTGKYTLNSTVNNELAGESATVEYEYVYLKDTSPPTVSVKIGDQPGGDNDADDDGTIYAALNYTNATSCSIKLNDGSYTEIYAWGDAHKPMTFKYVVGNGTHTVSLRCSNTAGEKSTSDSITVSMTSVVEDKEPPTKIMDLTASTGLDKIVLGWNKPTDNVGVDHYIIYRHSNLITEDNKNQATILDNNYTGAATSYTDENVEYDKLYFYAAVAVDAAGNQAALSNIPSASVTSPDRVINMPDVNPASGKTVTESDVTIILEFDEEVTLTRARLGGRSVDFETEDSRNFEYTKELDDDVYALEIGAKDSAGNSDSWTWQFTVSTDMEPPVPEFDPEDDDTITDDTHTLKIQFNEETEIISAELDGNDVTDDLDEGRDNKFTYKMKDLDEGPHLLIVEFTDKAGNVDTETITFTVELEEQPLTHEDGGNGDGGDIFSGIFGTLIMAIIVGGVGVGAYYGYTEYIQKPKEGGEKNPKSKKGPPPPPPKPPPTETSAITEEDLEFEAKLKELESRL